MTHLLSDHWQVTAPTINTQRQGEASMPNDPRGVIEFAIRSAFVSYPKEDEPDWKSPHWITPKECAHLATAVILELQAKGFEIVRAAAPPQEGG
jgi:hypothetical protein